MDLGSFISIQAKDADAAAGKKSGGFCGGGTKNVHDPTREPGPAPNQTQGGISPRQETESLDNVNKIPAAAQQQPPQQRLLRSELTSKFV
jgi:hypothetical protein